MSADAMKRRHFEDAEPMSRRGFLRGGFLHGILSGAADRAERILGNEPAAKFEEVASPRARNRSFPVLRPPGAIAEESFLEKCTRCSDCIDACPHDAIVHASARMRVAAGTPMIVTRESPCRMCSDTPCISACETGALLPGIGLRMGTAQIRNQTCLAHQNSFCTVCSEQCPVPGAIIVVDGKPQIDEEVCTGCGVCDFVCPAPEKAILLMPAMERPEVSQPSA